MSDELPEPVVPVEPTTGKTYSEDYVKSLRQEAAGYRTKVRELEPLATQLQEATARAEAAEKKLAEREAADERLSIALSKGLDPDLAPLISGGSKEEIEKNAELLAQRIGAKPKAAVTRDPASLQSGAVPSDGTVTSAKEQAALAVRQLRGSL